MAFIGDDLRTYWKTISGVTAFVGSGVHARIYQDAPKQGVKLPYIVYRMFEGFSAEDLSGITGVAQRRVQVDCYGATPKQADDVQEAIRLAPTQGHRGTVGSSFVHGITSPDTARSGEDPPPPGSKAHRYWSSRDYLVSYTEATS